MLGRAAAILFVVFSFGLFTSNAGAKAVFFFEAPYQLSPSKELTPVLLEGDALYERETYEAIGTLFTLLVDSFDAFPEDGDTWFISFDLQEPERRLSVIEVRYDAEQDCLLFEGSPFLCEIRSRVEEEGGIVRYRTFLFFNAQCVPTEDYVLAIEFQPGGGTRDELEGSPLPFRPTTFPVGEPVLQLSSSRIHPHIPAFSQGPALSSNPEIPAGQTLLVIAVRDGIETPEGTNCGVALPDIPVDVEATIVAESGSHLHFKEADEPGTGEFHDVAGNEEPITIDESGVKFSGKTNTQGAVFGAYQAGVYGVEESFQVTVTDPERDESKTVSINVEIQVPGLVPLDESGALYTLRGSFSPGCGDNVHNRSATDRLSHFVTPGMKSFAGELASQFMELEDIKLSYNDASLEFGGFFDKGAADRNAKCHTTHRHGVDLDVNASSLDYPVCDEGGARTIHCPAKSSADPRHLQVDMLHIIARRLGAYKMKESTIHYRLQSTAIGPQ